MTKYPKSPQHYENYTQHKHQETLIAMIQSNKKNNPMINITIIMESYASSWTPEISPKEYINPIHRRRGYIVIDN